MSLKDHNLKSNVKAPLPSELALMVPTLKRLSENELLELRHEIDKHLQIDLGQLDLAEELSLQYRQAKALLAECQRDNGTPMNQKSQIFNSVRAQLSDIVKQQEAVWSMERMKKFETAFIKAVDAMSESARAVFFDLYGTYLQDPTAPGADSAVVPVPTNPSGLSPASAQVPA